MQFRLAELRRRLNITQADLSERTGMNQAKISLLENGRVPMIRVNDVEAICQALDVSPNDLFGFDQAAQEQALQSLFRALDPADQEMVLSLAQRMLSSRER